MKKWHLTVLLIAVGLVAAMIFVPAFGRITLSATQVSSLSNLRQIAVGAIQFSKDNDGRMPNDLGDLYPGYVGKSAEVFFCAFQKSEGYKPNRHYRDLISVASIYRIARFDDRVFFYEQPGIWSDQTVAVIEMIQTEDDWKSGTIGRLPISEWEELILRYSSR